MSLRKIRFWVRALPRTKNRKRAIVLPGIYTSQRKAKAAIPKCSEQIAVSVEGFYWQQDGLVLSKEGKWVKP